MRLLTDLSECLTLIAAYPVCVIEQIRGNACEPAVTRYCQQAAQALQRLRNGGDIFPGAAGWKCMGSVSSNDRHNFADVEYFFEIFSLQLQIEFRRQKMKTRAPALASLHIIHNLRSHFENIVDLGNIDDRKSPVLRKVNIAQVEVVTDLVQVTTSTALLRLLETAPCSTIEILRPCLSFGSLMLLRALLSSTSPSTIALL